MKTTIAVSAVLALSFPSIAQLPAAKQSAGQSSSTSIQEMLISGPPQLKMHSMSMILQGKTDGKIDETYLPGLEICSQDISSPIRSMTAKILGINFIQQSDVPNPKALELLLGLSKDSQADVRFNAVYYGLSQIKTKSPEHTELLLDIAAKEQNPALQDRIIVSLANYQLQVEEILNAKLQDDNGIAYYEIYEEFTGKQPPNAEKFLNMPSSRPKLFVVKFKAGKTRATKAKSELVKDLKTAGIKEPAVRTSGTDENFVLMVTTYITSDFLIAKKFLTESAEYGVIQELLLTPELEVQIEADTTTP